MKLYSILLRVDHFSNPPRDALLYKRNQGHALQSHPQWISKILA